MKRTLSLLLAAVMLLVMAPFQALAFSDITDRDEIIAAETLQSLGIMSGKGGDVFDPNGYLTRAEFCKIATLASGFEEQASFQGYTIFPDVRSSHWAAGYINAAVRKYGIIAGYPDGTFRPEEKLTLAHAVTMLLRLLGYKDEDIGPNWPRDYIDKARALGITEGVTLGANDAIPRGKAAIITRNLLTTKTKDGSSFISTSFPSSVEDSILLATYETDPELSYGEARFHEGAEGSEPIVRKIDGTLPLSLVGCQGIAVLATKDPLTVRGFIPDTSAYKTAVVKRSYADRIETEDGTYKVSRTAKLVVNGALTNYQSGWYDLTSGMKINLFYTKAGSISLVSAEANTRTGASSIYGVSSFSVPQSANVIKNSMPATRADLRKYDAVYYSASDNTVYASDKKLKGVYESGTPSYNYPSSIVVSGKTFSVSESAATWFENIKIGSQIVLILDANGSVAAAFPAGEVAFDQYGILLELSESEAKIYLLNSGVTITGKPNLSGTTTLVAGREVSALYQLTGRLVKVTPLKEGLSFSSVPYDKTATGNWDLASGKIGSKEVSPRVRIYDQPVSGAPLTEIMLSDIPVSSVSSSKILHTTSDFAGRVDLIILDNVTGEGFTYGILTGETVEQTGDPWDTNGDGKIDEQDKPTVNTYHSVTLTTPDGANSYPTQSLRGVTGVPGAVAKNQSANVNALYEILTERVSVTRDAFDGSKAIKTADNYIPLADDVIVYVPADERFISLSEARANYETFTCYCDRAPADGGIVRIIYVQ